MIVTCERVIWLILICFRSGGRMSLKVKINSVTWLAKSEAILNIIRENIAANFKKGAAIKAEFPVPQHFRGNHKKAMPIVF